MPVVHSVYYDIQLTKRNKQVNKEKNRLQVKAYESRLLLGGSHYV